MSNWVNGDYVIVNIRKRNDADVDMCDRGGVNFVISLFCKLNVMANLVTLIIHYKVKFKRLYSLRFFLFVHFTFSRISTQILSLDIS